MFFRNLLNPMSLWVDRVNAGDYLKVYLLCKYGDIYYLDAVTSVYNHHYSGESRASSIGKRIYEDAPLQLNLYEHYDRDPKILTVLLNNHLRTVNQLFHMKDYKKAIRTFWNPVFQKHLLKNRELWARSIKTLIKVHTLFFLSKNVRPV